MEIWKQFIYEYLTMDKSLIYLQAVLPCLIFCVVTYGMDKYEKEPVGLMLKAFFLGVLLCLPAAVFSILLELLPLDAYSEDLSVAGISILLQGSMVEESLKFLVLMYVFYEDREFDEPFDGITYSVMVAMGFMSFDRISYLVLDYGFRDPSMLRYLDLVAFPAFAVILGYFIGLDKYKQRKLSKMKWSIIGLIITIVGKGFYDLMIFKKNLPLFNVAVVGVVMMAAIFSYFAILQHQKNSPFKIGSD